MPPRSAQRGYAQTKSSERYFTQRHRAPAKSMVLCALSASAISHTEA